MKKALLFAMVGAIPTSAFAQADNADPTLAEVVVTARRIAEPLQRTPVAVTALGEEQLRASLTQNVGDITQSVPNLTLVSGRGSTSLGFAFIRGVGQGDENAAVDPGVAQYIDDVYVGRAAGSLADLNDIASIEVLRGPQGTLYGKNTLGGAIKINSKLPGNEQSFDASVSYGNYSDVRAYVGVSQPLVEDKLFLRVSALAHVNDGFMDNGFNGGRARRTNDANDYSGRLILRYTPSSAVDIWLGLDATRDFAATGNPRVVAIDPTNAALGLSIARGVDPRVGLLAPGADPYKGGSFDNDYDPALLSPRSHNKILGSSLHGSFDLGAATLKSITAYRELNATRVAEIDAGPTNYANTVDYLDNHQFSQEFNLLGDALEGRFDWLAGLYYFREDSKSENKSNVLSVVNPNAKNDRFFNQVAKSYAAFVSVGYKLTDDLRLSAGGRYTEEKKRIFTTATVLNSPTVVFAPATRSAKFNDFSPRFGVDYQVAPDIFAYASASKGFKSGGFNARANLNQALLPFNSEKAWSYESGLKTQWLDRRVTLNVTGFIMDYKDIQEQIFAPRSDGVPGVASIIFNAAQARIKGVELEGSARLLPVFTLSGQLGYTDARYSKQFLSGPAGLASTVDFTNNKLPYTPKWTGRVNGRLAGPLSDGVEGSLDVSYSFRSKTFYDVTNTAVIAQDGYGLLDARAALTLENGFGVAVFGKNLNDKTYKQNGLNFLGSLGLATAYFGAPRTYGIELSWRR